MLFDGKVALVTGAGGGIGIRTARAFAEAGASVILADNDAALLEEAMNGLRSAGHRALAVPRDVRDRSHVRAMIAEAVKTYGRLDAAFNSAGINCDGSVGATTPQRKHRRVAGMSWVLAVSRPPCVASVPTRAKVPGRRPDRVSTPVRRAA